MANITVVWVPAGGIIGQRVFAKERTAIIWDSSNFILPNDQTAIATNATYTSAITNRVYQFKVNSICNGGLLSADSVIGEGVTFGCFDVVLSNITETSVTVTANDIHPDIINFVFVLYASDGTTVLQTSGALTAVAGIASYTFNSLTPGDTYKINTQSCVQLNNLGASSFACSSALNPDCYVTFTTTVDMTCTVYELHNSFDLCNEASFTWLDCYTGLRVNTTLEGGAILNICAQTGSAMLNGGCGTVTPMGDCPILEPINCQCLGCSNNGGTISFTYTGYTPEIYVILLLTDEFNNDTPFISVELATGTKIEGLFSASNPITCVSTTLILYNTDGFGNPVGNPISCGSYSACN